MEKESRKMVSIIMLVYNAPKFVRHSILTLNKLTKGVDYELIALDNYSNMRTRKLLLKLQRKGYIDKIIFEDKNTFFAKGNNTAAKLCAQDSTHILLLNSDVEICDEYWLKKLLDKHEPGAISYGVCMGEPHVRADGYCFLIDKEIYLKNQLDENFEWWWSVTKLQAQILREGYKVKAVKEHNGQLIHYGKMSGMAWKNSRGMLLEGQEVKKWFEECEVEIIEHISETTGIIKESRFSRRVRKKKQLKQQYKDIEGKLKRVIKRVIKSVIRRKNKGFL